MLVIVRVIQKPFGVREPAAKVQKVLRGQTDGKTHE